MYPLAAIARAKARIAKNNLLSIRRHSPLKVGFILLMSTLLLSGGYFLLYKGLNFIECLQMFEADDETEAIIMVGEIGGSDEEAAAEYIKSHVTKPVAAYIAGQTAPAGKRMGHAGAIISGGSGKASDKIRALEFAGAVVASSPAGLGEAVLAAINSKK